MSMRSLLSPALPSVSTQASVRVSAQAAARAVTVAALTLAAATLTGCSGGAEQAPPAAAAPSGPDTCGVTSLQGHIGEFFDVTMLQNFEAIVPSHRVLVMKPDTLASTDVVPERAIVKTDNKSNIISITCG